MASTKDASIAAALDGYLSGAYSSIRQAARAHHIPHTTLSRRVRGTTKSHTESASNLQALPPLLENQLAAWILKCEAAQSPASHKDIIIHAQLLCKTIGRMEPLGHHWIQRFLRRHPQLKCKTGSKNHAARVHCIAEVRLQKWFHNVYKAIDEYNIRPQNLYNPTLVFQWHFTIWSVKQDVTRRGYDADEDLQSFLPSPCCVILGHPLARQVRSVAALHASLLIVCFVQALLLPVKLSINQQE